MKNQDASASAGTAMANPDATLLEAAMQVPITVWLGPVGPLLRKLHSLMPPALLSADEIRLLQVLCISLKDMSEDEDPGIIARWWMTIVRELCYDTDDQLDEVAGAGAGAHHDFSELLARAKDAIERRKYFQWSPPKTIKPAQQGGASVGRPKLPVPLAVQVEPPRKLVELLDLDDGEKTLKVIPVYGCAGHGKTTAARTLYHKHAGKFQSRAFITVSRNPDMSGFLTGMLSQLKAPQPHGFPDVTDLIDAISGHLQGKRYLIVIDDLWTASVWNIISRAFPRGDYYSRIITTTQIDDVALACCNYDSNYIYRMEPLNDDESAKLFFSRVFGSEDGCPRDIKEVSSEIIRKCGGLPLAIVSIASLLANESDIVMEKWKHVHDSLPSTSVGIKDVLNVMYNSLPPRLRTCLLYLSMYQQGYVIKKDELVKQWVAEDFLSAVGEQGPEEIAEYYFDELVSRGLVQAMESNKNGELLSCSVHQIVLDFIRRKSREENFVITVDYFQSTLALTEKVRRLSIQFGAVKSAYIPETIITSQVRSLIFGGFFECVPNITDYRLLRVLILHIWADEENESFDLTGIGELFLLKYLKIECNITVKLPGKDKFRWLQHLETLEVHARLSAVPSDIVNLKTLVHLCLQSEYILPSLVAHMTTLRTLGYFDVGNYSVEEVLHLAQLTNLQDLQLTCSMVQPAEKLEKNVQLLGSILEKLGVLRSVSLVPAASGYSCVNIPEGGFNMVSPPPDLILQRIELSRRCCIFCSLPKWFGELKKLSILKIGIRRLSKNDTDILKGLPALTALTLYVQTVSEEKIVIGNGGFQVLMYFKFMCAAPCLSFVQGAMPKVQKLMLCFNSIEPSSHTFGAVAFSHLIGLTEVSVKLGVRHADNFNIKSVESALKDEVKSHPNTIILIRVQFIDVISYGTTTTKGREKMLQEIREGKKKIMEHSEEQDENRQEIHVDNKTITEILEVQEESQLEIIIDTKKITEISEVQVKKQMEIQEDKKKVTERSEEHVNKQDESRYAITGHPSTPPKYHTQSFNTVTGAMGPLLSKLLELLKDEHKLQTNVKNRVQSLHKELEALQDALLEVAKREPTQLDHVTRTWAKEVRDLSYDADDVVNSLLVQVKGSQGLIARFVGLLSTRKAHHEISDAVTGMMKQTKDLAARRENIVGVHTSNKPNAAGSLFDSKPINDWSKVYNNIGFGSEGGGNTDANNRRKILLCAYYDLPYYLRACLLHLHIFPENYLIKKETLIWKWAAEGLIVEKQGTGLFELGEGYLQELIDRNLVLPVEDDSHCGKVIGCHVHAEIIEMICFLSTEENFVTVLDGSKQCSPVKSKARRLAVQKWTTEQGDPLANIRRKSLRSFNAMGCLLGRKLSLSRFKLLRVLAIEECECLLLGHIKHVGKLHLLRYLGLYNTYSYIEKLPEDIGDLIYLQTLDLRGTEVRELPRGVAQLRQLKCLRTDEKTAIPDWMGNLTSLEELRLGYFVMWSINFVTELGKLTELRELEIHIKHLNESRQEALVQSLRKLEKIQVLRLMGHVDRPGVDEFNWRDFDPPHQLRELHLSIPSTRLPSWINVSFVPMLSHLVVNLKSIGDQDLDILGALPDLISLELVLPSDAVLSINGRYGAFPRLRCFCTSVPAWFLPGAMPRLAFLRFQEAAPFYFGDNFVVSTLGNLPSLQKVEGVITFRAHYFKAMRAALKRAVDEHPNRPTFNVIAIDWNRGNRGSAASREVATISGGSSRVTRQHRQN